MNFDHRYLSRSIVAVSIIAAATLSGAETKPANPPAEVRMAPIRANPGVIAQPTPLAPRPPEPAGVFGWIAITDPTTGEPWLPKSYETDPPTVRGYPGSVEVHFVAIATGERHSVSIFGGGLAIVADRERNAWRYAVPFIHVATASGNPYLRGTSISYNPALWRYDRHEMAEYRWTEQRPGSTRVLWSVPFAPRATPFERLPAPPAPAP